MALKDARRCKATSKRSGERCKNPAVTGYDVCRIHGGKTPRGIASPNYKTGLYSRYLPSGINDKVQAFIEADPLELVSEMALLRALLAEYVGRFADMSPSARDIEILADLTERVGKFGERIGKMRNDTALTGAELTYLAARVADIVVKYIDDPNQQRAFVSEFLGTLGKPRAEEPGPARLTSDN